jgi:hypothetical protein
MIPILAVVHLAATFIMIGIIWIVQLVHYPLFRLVGESSFKEYERSHCARISFIVVPVMLIELFAAGGLYLLVADPHRPYALSGLLLLGVIWGATFAVHVPCHDRLGRGFDEATWRTLVRSNWLRTIAWTARGGVALTLLS